MSESTHGTADTPDAHGHDHDHDHDHAPPQPDDKVHSYYQILGQALKELLIEKGIVTADEVREAIEKRDSITPARGARIVARAWADPEFKALLMRDANQAAADMGAPTPSTHLVAVENTDAVHNVIVCTLCSCYPRELLGLPPSWYKSRQYRARIVREPRAVLKEFGTELADDVEIRVHDSTADIRYLVVPQQPEGTDGLSTEELESLITRDSMIGVTEVKAPG
jgi:nitrile hydratase alpha subunit